MDDALKITVIFNPFAGMGRFGVSGSDMIFKIRKRAQEKNVPVDIEIRETHHKGECQDLALEASRSGTDIVAVAGGDGTVFEAVNSLVGTDTSLGIIPIGSGNDDIVSISGHNDIYRCIDDIIAGEQHLLDSGSMNGISFLNVAGIGLDAKINHHVSKNRGQVRWLGPALTYTVAAFRVLLRYEPYRIEYEIDGEDMGERVITLCTIGNGTTCGGGYRLTPRARMDDGLLDLSISGYPGKARSVMNIKKAYKGEHIRLKENTYDHFREAKIKSIEGELPYHMDGEAGFADKMEFRLVRNGIRTVHPLLLS